MYDLELDKIVSEIKKINAKTVCIQLPDGLKPRANEIQEKIEKETSALVLIWAGSCYGACDLPNNLEGVDLLVHFGHSEWVL
jgi:2-(3-amino-3-carboxypropyl)histidine synthase